MIIGGILAFALAWYERFVLGYDRATGEQVAIMFGDTGMMLGMLSFAASTFFLSPRRYVCLALALIGGLCGMGASFLSGSRGVGSLCHSLAFSCFGRAAVY
ncbi:hypothetical protein P4S72_07030 [Vibrio sp. PP-XX7]